MAKKNIEPWCPFAEKKPAYKYNYNKGRTQHPQAVVMHIADGTIEGMDAWFANKESKVSAHFGISKSGAIHQYVAITDTAYANGLLWYEPTMEWVCPHGKVVRPLWSLLIPGVNPNDVTISIEHEGKSGEPWTKEMYDADVRLLRWIGEQCDIKYVPNMTLLRHSQLDPAHRANCPGAGVSLFQICEEVEHE